MKRVSSFKAERLKQVLLVDQQLVFLKLRSPS